MFDDGISDEEYDIHDSPWGWFALDEIEVLDDWGWQHYSEAESPSSVESFEIVKIVNMTKDQLKHYKNAVGQNGYVRSMFQKRDRTWQFSVVLYVNPRGFSHYEIGLSGDQILGTGQVDQAMRSQWENAKHVKVFVDSSGHGRIVDD